MFISTILSITESRYFDFVEFFGLHYLQFVFIGSLSEERKSSVQSCRIKQLISHIQIHDCKPYNNVIISMCADVSLACQLMSKDTEV